MKQLLTSVFYVNASKSRSEQYILLSVAIIGLLGSFYLIQKCQHNVTSHKTLTSTNIIYSPTSSISLADLNYSFLEMRGDLNEDTPIEFSLNEIEDGKKFLVDFGNGEQKVISNESFFYSYNRPGNYKVKLIEMDREKLRTVESRVVLISRKGQLH